MMKNICIPFFLLMSIISFAQSPDSKICNCRAEPISNDFMNATTIKTGAVISRIIPGTVIRPDQDQTVHFTVPKMISKAGCTSKFTLAIYDDSTNARILETTSVNNFFSYSFKSCTKKYRVTLISFTTSGGGNDGNCRRSISFYVEPKCLVQQCNCFTQSSKAGKTPISGDLNIDGKIICKTATSTHRNYVLQYMIINKTDCNLKVERIIANGQTITLPVFSVLPKGRSATLTESFQTGISVAATSGPSVRITIQYSLNGKRCSTSMDLTYVSCH